MRKWWFVNVRVKWFVNVRSRDAPVTSAVLEEKANHLAGLFGNTEFIATNGWLCGWKSRQGIKFKKLHGEKKDADNDSGEGRCFLLLNTDSSS